MSKDPLESNSIPISFWALLALLLVGLADAGFIVFQELSQTSFCSSTGIINCTALSDPRYSKWFGVPVGVYAFFFYVFSFWIASISLRQRLMGRRDEENTKVLFILATLSLLPTVGLAVVSAAILKSFCPYCMVLYAVSILSWVLTYKMRKELEDRRLSNDRFLLFGVAFVVYMSVVPYVFYKMVPGFRLGSTAQVIAGENQRTLGDPSSPHTIVKFSDFQCPMCKYAAENLKAFERDQRGNVKVIYKFYPLDSECNPNVRHKMHPDSCRAAVAAYCASQQGKFWSFHDLVFENQQALPDPLLEAFASMLNLNMDEYRACRSSSEARNAIAKNIEEGDRLGVGGTPTLFIDGKKFEGQITVDALREAVSP